MPEPFIVGEDFILGDRESVLSFIAIVLMAYDAIRGELSEEEVEAKLERYRRLAERVLEELSVKVAS